MPIRPPALDDRRFDDLVAELVQRIPAHTPEWTNPRLGDPGRTLIELFAWLGDALLYRVNLIPERQRLAFLRLLGQPLRPAQPARGLVVVSWREPAGTIAATAIRPGASFAGPVPFETRDEFTVLPITSSAWVKRPVSRSEVPIELEALAEFHNDGDEVAGYATTPLFATTPPAAEGFDIVADTADRCLWIGLFAPPARDPASQSTTNGSVEASLAKSASGGRQVLNIGLVPALPTADPLEPVTVRPSVPHIWEVSANRNQGEITAENPWRPQYITLDVIDDGTVGLTRQGVVRLALPPNEVIFAPTNDVRLDPDAGVGDRPPRLDDEDMAARLVGWLRLRPAPGPPPAPAPETQFVAGEGAPNLQSSQSGAAQVVRQVENLRIVWAGVNAVEVEQLATRSGIVIGESSGIADQEFALPSGSVEPGTLVIQVVEDGGARIWQRVDDLATLDRDALASRDARAYELDAEGGTLRFGDGVRGRIPSAGARIIVRQMRSGGGVVGNLTAGSLKAVSAQPVVPPDADIGRQFIVTQPLPFTGGSDSETLAEAEKRIPSLFRHRDRAVTPDDYRSIAFETPGVSVGRVELLPRFKPQQRHEDIPGIVTVMALPARPLAPAPNPRADRPFLEAIHARLDVRKPLGTELYVIGCEYVPVAVSVAVMVAPEAPLNTTLQALKEALIRVLWPLAPGGFDQNGWPLGRELSNRELAVETARVAGVTEVAGLNLFRRNPDSGEWQPLGDARDAIEQNLPLDRWQLPELLAVIVSTGESAPLTIDQTGSILDPGSPTNPYILPGKRPLTVPIVPELC